MHQAASLQFERVMDELVLWHAVPEDERSPAPAWWWGPAMAVCDTHEPMRHAWCCELGLGDGSSFAELEEVGNDILRRWVLAGGAGDIEAIVNDRLDQRTKRFVSAY